MSTRSDGHRRAPPGFFDGASPASIVIVDNALVASSEVRTWANGCFLISGDNKLHEFSGWERGYDVACKEFQLGDSDLILFANDTFDRQAHLGYLDTLNRELVQNENMHRSSIGFCDDLPRDARLLELTHRWWLRSNIFMHPKPIVDRLNAEIAKALKADDIRAFMVREALDPVASSPEALRANFEREIARYAKIIKAGNITVQ